jgi:uncharacterized protein (TIGR03067 family)
MDRNRVKHKWHASAVLAIALTGTLCAGDPSDWEEVTSREGSFSIKFPLPPKYGTVGKGESEFKTARVVSDKVGYSLYWKLRDKPFDNAAAVESYIKEQQKSATTNGKVIKEEEITFDGHKAREFTVADSDLTSRYRIMVVDKLICTLVIVGQTRESVNTEDAERFFKSFKITKQNRATGAPISEKEKELIQKLQGKWIVVSGVVGGEDVPAEEIKDFTIVFEGNKLIAKEGKKDDVATFTLDVEQKPIWLDTVHKNPDPLLGIISLEGDTLKICSFKSKNKRPADFKSEKGSESILLVLKREKK